MAPPSPDSSNGALAGATYEPPEMDLRIHAPEATSAPSPAPRDPPAAPSARRQAGRGRLQPSDFVVAVIDREGERSRPDKPDGGLSRGMLPATPIPLGPGQGMEVAAAVRAVSDSPRLIAPPEPALPAPAPPNRVWITFDVLPRFEVPLSDVPGEDPDLGPVMLAGGAVGVLALAACGAVWWWRRGSPS